MRSHGKWLPTLTGIAVLAGCIMQLGMLGDARAETQTATQTSVVQQGEDLFEENCTACHQEKGRGQIGIAPSLTGKEFLSIVTDRFLISTIRDGRTDTNMAAFNDYLTEEQIKEIVVYLRSLATLPERSAAVEAQPQAMGDPRLGKLWFRQICAGCHGENGEGYAHEGSGTAIGKAGFLDKASDGFIRTIISEGRSNTPMRGFVGSAGLANLSHQEIDDIITFLRTVPGK